MKTPVEIAELTQQTEFAKQSTSIRVPYTCYGKIFLNNGATDWNIIQSSHDTRWSTESAAMSIRDSFIGLRNYSDYQRESERPLFFQSPDSPVGCFAVNTHPRAQFCAQLWHAREGAFAKQKGNDPRINRPFTSSHLYDLKPDEIKNLYRHGYAVYPCMFFPEFRFQQGMASQKSVPAKINMNTIGQERAENGISTELLLTEQDIPLIAQVMDTLSRNPDRVNVMINERDRSRRLAIAHTVSYLMAANQDPQSRLPSFIMDPITRLPNFDLIFKDPSEVLDPEFVKYRGGKTIVDIDPTNIQLSADQTVLADTLYNVFSKPVDQAHHVWMRVQGPRYFQAVQESN